MRTLIAIGLATMLSTSIAAAQVTPTATAPLESSAPPPTVQPPTTDDGSPPIAEDVPPTEPVATPVPLPS